MQPMKLKFSVLCPMSQLVLWPCVSPVESRDSLMSHHTVDVAGYVDLDFSASYQIYL